ncbi:MAG: hypothetical protein RJB01_1311 [Actinomycetota bacterium]|jgi:hypothetical protein
MRVLGSSVLGFEAIVVFLAMPLLAINGAVDSMGAAFGIGAVIAVGLIGAVGGITKPWGLALGSLLQVVVVGLGFWVPTMWLIGGLFAILWAVAVWQGRKIDRLRQQGTGA